LAKKEKEEATREEARGKAKETEDPKRKKTRGGRSSPLPTPPSVPRSKKEKKMTKAICVAP